MKFHWGECPVHKWENLFNKSKMFHEEEVRNLKNHVNNLFKQNEEIIQSHTQLEECIAKYQAKIAHLEEVISDYSKASLLEKSPAYVEIVPLPEQEKPKRKAR
jgi:hypothetical protein